MPEEYTPCVCLCPPRNVAESFHPTLVRTPSLLGEESRVFFLRPPSEVLPSDLRDFLPILVGLCFLSAESHKLRC